MKNDFFKFPSTPHLKRLTGLDIRDDKILSKAEYDKFIKNFLVIEEKIDGANLGISFNKDGKIITQNRGAYLHSPAFGQWKKLNEWLEPRKTTLFDNLSDRFILFGEWCYAQHSIFYNKLPDWFIGFDIYDKESNCFLSTERRNALLQSMSIVQVPLIATGHFRYKDIENFLSASAFSDDYAEGIYLRIDQEDRLKQRAKLVRPSFTQTLEKHWSRSIIKPNQLKPDNPHESLENHN